MSPGATHNSHLGSNALLIGARSARKPLDYRRGVVSNCLPISQPARSCHCGFGHLGRSATPSRRNSGRALHRARLFPFPPRKEANHLRIHSPLRFVNREWHGDSRVVRQTKKRTSAKHMTSADTTIEEAHHLTRKLIEYERGKCGGRVETALFRASQTWGIEEGQLRTLWHRWRSLKFVKAHVLDRLRQIDAVLEEKAKRERHILAETAETLERVGHPAARLARYAADLVSEEEGAA